MSNRDWHLRAKTISWSVRVSKARTDWSTSFFWASWCLPRQSTQRGFSQWKHVRRSMFLLHPTHSAWMVGGASSVITAYGSPLDEQRRSSTRANSRGAAKQTCSDQSNRASVYPPWPMLMRQPAPYVPCRTRDRQFYRFESVSSDNLCNTNDDTLVPAD